MTNSMNEYGKSLIIPSPVGEMEMNYIKPKTLPVRNSGVILLTRVLIEGFKPAVAISNKKRATLTTKNLLRRLVV